MWDEAHGYFATDDYVRADSLFSLLAREFPETNEGRESLFYLGAMHLDPRNPEWDSEAAEKRLREYLAADGEEGLIHRRPEGETLFELAYQLNLPMEQRIPDLQVKPQTRVIVKSEVVQGAMEETDELRAQLAAREEEVRQLREELERIRRTLTGP